MPKVFPNNKYWLRREYINQKRHAELTEQERENIARCDGQKHTHPCKNPVFRCPECGNYGCDQATAELCTAQGFKNDKCLNCGVVGKSVPVMQDELDEFIAEWNKEVPETK